MAKKIQRSNMTATDDKGRVIREPRDNAIGEAVNYKWWTLEGTEMAYAIGATVKFLKERQSARQTMLVTATRLYGNSNLFNIMGTSSGRASTANSPQDQKISFNVIESVIDTLESKMAKNKVVPTYITNGGDWSAQKKAKQLTKFTQGLFYQQKVHQKSVHAWKDGAVWGDGFVKIFEKDDKVCIERAFPHDLLVDMVESNVTNMPQQLHQTKLMDREIALSLFPELEENIKSVSPATYQEIGGQGTAADIIDVIESWHLKSGPDAQDGVHVITIGDGVICEDYQKDYYPFAHNRYVRRQTGWYGQGICERLMRLQTELNRCMVLKQRCIYMIAGFKILLEIGSKVVSQHLNTDVGTIINYAGTRPDYITPPATNGELQQWIDWCISHAYQQEGISQMSSTGEAPLGVDSGKALRTLTQISEDRFFFMSKELEDFTLEIARQAVNIVKDIYARTGKYEVIFPDKRFMETVDWADIQLDEEQYVLKAFPTSSLSDDLTGRLADIQEMMQAGLIDPQQGKRLLDMPDVEADSALANSQLDRLHQIFENMLDDKEVVPYEPGMYPAQLAQQMALKYINYAEYMKCPENRVQLVRDFLAEINSNAMGPVPPQMPQGAPIQPQANPTSPPTNNMIPNVPGVSA